MFVDGQTSVNIGPYDFDIQGLAFSTLDYNLWHVTTTRKDDAGHGNTPTFDYNVARATTQTGAGNSFYFGLEDPRDIGGVGGAYAPQQPGSYRYIHGLQENPALQSLSGNESLFGSYNLPGGAKGSLTSAEFSLADYSAEDKPTLYFNYALDTEGANSDKTAMRDSFRVYGTRDGVNWIELTTNNSVPSIRNSTSAELPSYASDSGGLYQSDKSTQRVQEAFDPTGTDGVMPGNYLRNDFDQPVPTDAVQWRQARVDLGDLAGTANIKLRFDFSTAGSMGTGITTQVGVYMGAKAGSELTDGQTFTLDQTAISPGTTFTLRQGLSLFVPAGGGVTIPDGETFTIEGITYEFDKNSSVSGGNTAVPITNAQTSEQVADAIFVSIANNPPAGVTPVRDAGYSVDVPTGGGANMINGETLTLNDRVFEFRNDGNFGGTNVAVPFSSVLQVQTPVNSVGMANGETFTVNGAMFEMRRSGEFGTTLETANAIAVPVGSTLSLQVPNGGGLLLNGETFKINGTTFELRTSGPATGSNTLVLYNPADTAAQITAAISTAIQTAGIGVTATQQTTTVNNDTLKLTGATSLARSTNHTTRVAAILGTTASSTQVATNLAAAITSANVGVTPARNGNTITLLGATSATHSAVRTTVLSALKSFSDSTAAEVTARLIDAVIDAGIGITPVATGTSIQFAGAGSASQSVIHSLVLGKPDTGTSVQLVGATTNIVQSPSPKLVVQGSVPGGAGPTDIFYQINWTAEQVAQAIAVSLDAALTVPGNFDDPTIFTSSKLNGSVLQVIGHTVTDTGETPTKPGPVTLSTSLQGDQFGLYYSPVSSSRGISDVAARERGQNNAHEGVYIDDIIVGFSGRGEMVSGNFNPLSFEDPEAPDAVQGDTSFTALPTRDFSDPKRITTGPFQLTVKRGTEYGVSLGGSVPYISLFDTFDINDRQVQAITLVAPAGSALADGQTFRINGLLGTQVFEFDFDNSVAADHIRVALHAEDSAHAVAEAIQTAINTVPVAKKFEVKAGVVSGSANVDLYGAIEVDEGPLGYIEYHGTGDTLPVKLQGYTILQNNKISNALQAGIIVQPAISNITETGFQLGDPNHTYSVANLPVANSSRLVPGIAIKDNLIVKGGQTGIAFSGAPATDIASAVPFGRIVNNTIVQTPFGIQVVNNASPTLINNIIAETGTAIRIDNTSGTTVVQATTYKQNGTNLTAPGGFVQSTAIVLAEGAPLFVDSSKGNFYLAAGSAAIDSSINTLQQRDTLVAVTNALGMLPSPIQAPEHDLYGQLRVDDPTVAPPSGPGYGSNVFKDRGAIERSDALGPIARLFNPLDNDAALVDQNQVVNKVIVVGKTLKNFEIQLNDGGLGVDDETVTSDKFVIQRTAGGSTTTLTPEVDYTLEYENTSNIVLVTPVAGVWTNATYTINVNNSTATGIKDLVGNKLQPNESSGVTQFVIQLTDTATSTWQNPVNKYDVNGDGNVYPLDVLIIINRLLAGELGPLPPTPVVPPYLDVSGDGNLTPLDVLQVINYLNAQSAGSLATPAAATPAAAAPSATTADSGDMTEAFAAATMVTVADAATTPVAIAAAQPVASEPPTAAGAVAFSLSTQATAVGYDATASTSIDVTTGSDAAVTSPTAISSAKMAALEDDVWASDAWDSGDWESDDTWDEIAADLCEDSAALS